MGIWNDAIIHCEFSDDFQHTLRNLIVNSGGFAKSFAQKLSGIMKEFNSTHVYEQEKGRNQSFIIVRYLAPQHM